MWSVLVFIKFIYLFIFQFVTEGYVLLAASYLLQQDILCAETLKGNLKEQKLYLEAIAKGITALVWTQMGNDELQTVIDTMSGVQTEYSYCLCREGEMNYLFQDYY